MILKTISLSNFRNFKQQTYLFSPKLTIIVGENAKGKTNLLEAIYFISTGYGFRETKEEELILVGKILLNAEGAFDINNNDRQKFQIILRKQKDSIARFFLINRAKKKLSIYQSETTKAILFSPEQIAIITGSPEKRRIYIDKILCFYDLDYKNKLNNLEKALYKRNKLFVYCKDNIKLKEELKFWNKYLEDQAEYITKKRQDYISFLNENNLIDKREFYVDYVKNELTQKRLEKLFEKEIKYKRTLIGPQKDDFIIYQKKKGKQNKDLSKFGSRSEQRLGIFWLKLNEIKFYEKNYNKKPILLLDDIFSELDKNNRKLILNVISKYQTIITMTDKGLLKYCKGEKVIINL